MSAAYQAFISASYKVMSYVPDAGIQRDLSTLMDTIGEQGFMVYPVNDELYRKVMEQIMPYVQTAAPVKKDGFFPKTLAANQKQKATMQPATHITQPKSSIQFLRFSNPVKLITVPKKHRRMTAMSFVL